MLINRLKKPTHLFFSDIDGTLLRGSSGIAAEVKEAAEKFRQAGGGLVLSTGRAALSTRWVAEELGVNLPCILLTGSLTYDFKTSQAVACLPLPAGVLELAENILARYPDFALMAYGLERIYLLRPNAYLLRRGVKEEIPDRPTPISEIHAELGKLVLVSEDVEKLRECGQTLCSGPDYHFAFASRHFAEIVAAGADKGAAALRLAAQLGVAKENTFAAGDAMTDFPLLAACQHRFAMADAPPELRALSQKVVPTCEENGMATAFLAALALLKS